MSKKLTNAEKCRRHREKKRARERQSRVTSPDEIFQWVASVLRHELPSEGAQSGTVKEEDAPCPEAWGLYLACKRDRTQERAFWSKYIARLDAQSKPDAQAQAQAKADDKRRVFKFIEALYRERPDMLERKRQYEQERAAKEAERRQWIAPTGQPIVGAEADANQSGGGPAIGSPPEPTEPGPDVDTPTAA